MSKRTRKMLLSLMIVGVIGSVAGWGVYAAFTATTTNTGNTITAGTVNIAQHAGSTTLYSASNQGPGATTVGCIRVTYSGSLAASVKLYLNICQRQATREEPAPQTIDERLFASTIAINGGKYDEALSHLRLVRDEDPDNDHALYMLAVAHAAPPALPVTPAA